jgi:DNA polymerase III subunit gamma/tau
MLSQAAFNAFLKTLEEPPAYAKFILATTEKHKIIPTILSRCQIFDFSRITIEDIARQLEFVANNENIQTEYDALHVIAQKADGAMRDALSIFDQIVSFAGNNVTYKAVVENLNVLDYDYFFAMTDHILAGQNSEILLLFNTIINKGFDGSHFIGGYSSHLRNLLMCRDPRTVKLMDVGENIKQKYLEQAAKCPAGFLLKALDISNKCDISYRNSNNKRLHVELSLLQISALFHSPQPAAAAGVAPSMPVSAPPAPSPAVTPPASSTTKSSYPTPPATAPSVAAPTTPAPAAVASSPQAPPPSAFSIKINPTSSDEDEKKKEQLTSPEEEEERPEDQFSQADMNAVWEKLKDQYRNTSPVIFTALNIYPPVMVDEITIEIGVDNLVQKDSFFEQKPQILSFIRKQLNNYAINFTVVVKENTRKAQKAYLPIEKYQKMIEKNPEIENLKNDLDLDLLY